MAVTVVEVVFGDVSSGATVGATLTTTPISGDVLVYQFESIRTSGARTLASVSNAAVGGSWSNAYTGTRVAYWINTTATAAGAVSGNYSLTGAATCAVYLIRGLASATVTGSTVTATGTTLAGTAISAGNGQIVLFGGTAATTTTPSFPDSPSPGSGWDAGHDYAPSGFGGTTYRIPTDSPAANHVVSVSAGASSSQEVTGIAIGTFAALGLGVTDSAATSSDAAYLETVTIPLAITDSAATTTDAAYLETVALPLAITDDTATATDAGYVETVLTGVAITDDAATSTDAAYLETVTIPLAITDDTAAASVDAPLETVDDGSGVMLLSAPSPRGASVASFELYAPAPDVLLLSAPSLRRASVRIAPTATPVPATITEHPLMRRAHLMPPKSEAEPVRMGDQLRARAEGSDGYLYPIEEAEVGRFRVFASGIDVTYWTGAPTTVHDWSFAKPFSCKAASFTVPLREWEVPGVGPLSVLWADASIEIALEDGEGNLRHLWDGFTAEEEDVSAPGQTGVTWHCEGTLMQAAHWPWDAPIIMEERDIGHVIADAMNSVPNHRYVKFKRFTTGKTTTTRGDSSQSVLSNVLKWIEEAYSDDEQQLEFRRVGPFAYVIDWAMPAVTPQYTYTKGSPGFKASLTRPHSSRRDAVFGRGVAPDGGFWMNRVFPGLLASMPPAYPMANPSDNMSVGTTDADTVGGLGVTTWQRQMRVAGYPVVVDGVVNSADTKWILKIQQDRGLLANGVLGPQTWAATWEGGPQTPETLTYRLPIAVKDSARPYNYDASGKILGDNPLFDRTAIVYATPEVDAGTNIKKTTFIPLAAKILTREGDPGYVGSLTATGVDPWEEGESRLFITDGRNVEVLGHHGGVVVQTAEVTQTPQSTRMTVDSRARGQAVVDAVMARERDVRRDLAARATRTTDRGALNASQLGQYESESPAGKYSRTAINGDVGLWTVRCIYVAEQGLARFRLESSPKAELVTAVFDRHVTPNQVASINPDPLADAQPWRDNEALGKRLGLIEVCGTPESPGGYYPYTKSGDSAGPLTGVDMVGNLSMKSSRGGFFWIAEFTSRSSFVEGEFEPEVYET